MLEPVRVRPVLRREQVLAAELVGCRPVPFVGVAARVAARRWTTVRFQAAGVCRSRPRVHRVRARTFLPWYWSLRAAPLPHRTDCCRPIRRRGGVKGRFACTLTTHFPLCSLPCGHIGP
jgi:hypothetical protein